MSWRCLFVSPGGWRTRRVRYPITCASLQGTREFHSRVPRVSLFQLAPKGEETVSDAPVV